MIKIQLTFVNAELQEILDTFRGINPEYRLETFHKLQKLIPTAQALVEETRDEEHSEILISLAARITRNEGSASITKVFCVRRQSLV
jgi:hypothetical protein